MFVTVSRQDFLDRIATAARDDQGLNELREFIFNHYWNEDEYVFESEEVEWIFAVLLPYFQVEEALGDSRRQERMANLREALEHEFSPESAVLGLEFDRVADLVQRFRAGRIRMHLFRKKIEELTPARIDKGKLFEGVSSRWVPELTNES
jgi:hypothetical protein